jgi:hypothetical protein
MAGTGGPIRVRPVPLLPGAGHDVPGGAKRTPARVERVRVTRWLDSDAA